ncbi:MAG: hypothetical protein WA985_04360 [Erythrobacter sp.]|uniref:hypothetical protein n=1 Tax=Erythrobacter sp. TaxID=1042 RepID=UPI003C770FA5
MNARISRQLHVSSLISALALVVLCLSARIGADPADYAGDPVSFASFAAESDT